MRSDHYRRSIRLPDHDYSQPGAYFITICTFQRECLFGEIIEGNIQLNEYGKIVQDRWSALPNHYPNLYLDAFVVMPNHVHGILVLLNPPVGAGLQTCPANPPKQYAISEMVRGFKTYSARRINDLREQAGTPVWQRNYYEHIIRNETELSAIREYIVNNPAQWDGDQDNPTRFNSQEP